MVSFRLEIHSEQVIAFYMYMANDTSLNALLPVIHGNINPHQNASTCINMNCILQCKTAVGQFHCSYAM